MKQKKEERKCGRFNYLWRPLHCCFETHKQLLFHTCSRLLFSAQFSFFFNLKQFLTLNCIKFLLGWVKCISYGLYACKILFTILLRESWTFLLCIILYDTWIDMILLHSLTYWEILLRFLSCGSLAVESGLEIIFY